MLINMRTSRSIWVLRVGLLAVLCVAGCGQAKYAVPNASLAGPGAAGREMRLAQQEADTTGGAMGSAEAPKAESAQASINELAQSQPDRYLIKNANVTVEVKDARKATEELVRMITASKGYVSNVRETVDGLGARSAVMQVRIPFTSFDQSMDGIGGLGKVLDKRVTAEDVTEEFVDIQAKLRNLKRTEARLLDHLARSGKLSDTLLVEKELTRVRQEIEQLEGRMRFLTHRIAFSTIDVTLQETPKQQALVPPESYDPMKEGSDAVRALVVFGRGLLSFVIWVAVWAVVWAPALAMFWWLSRKGRGAHKQRWQPNDPAD
jgi:hypothetical protein